MRTPIYKLCWAIQKIIAPGLRNSQYAYRDMLEACVNNDVRWLDLGCGHELLPAWMPSSAEKQTALVHRCRIVVGIDTSYNALRKHDAIRNRVVGDIQRLPFDDCSFDLVTANVVLEHVRDPNAMLAEVKRVLRPTGAFLFHTPNMLGYATLISRVIPAALKKRLIKFLQGRQEEDVFSAYYRINTPRTVRVLAGQNGLQVSEIRLVESSAQTVMLGPLVLLLELIWIRILRNRLLSNFRTNILAVLRKPSFGAGRVLEEAPDVNQHKSRGNFVCFCCSKYLRALGARADDNWQAACIC